MEEGSILTYIYLYVRDNTVGKLVFEFKFWKISLPEKVGIAIL